MFLPKVEMSGGNERSACQLDVVYNEKSLSEMKGDLVMLEVSLILYRLGPGYVVASWTPVDRKDLNRHFREVEHSFLPVRLSEVENGEL